MKIVNPYGPGTEPTRQTTSQITGVNERPTFYEVGSEPKPAERVDPAR